MEVPVAPVVSLTPGPSRTLLRRLDELVARSSSAQFAGAATAAAAPPGASPAERSQALRRRRAEDARVAQLRGIFAAFDLDRDGYLSVTELERAVLALGVRPVPEVITLFTLYRRTWLLSAPQSMSTARLVDLDTFVYVVLNKLPSPETTEPDMLAACRVLDPSGTGRISLASLLHLLCEVDTARSSALSAEEVTELLRLAGVLTPAQLSQTQSDASSVAELQIAYEPFVRRLMFRFPGAAGSSLSPAAGQFSPGSPSQPLRSSMGLNGSSAVAQPSRR